MRDDRNTIQIYTISLCLAACACKIGDTLSVILASTIQKYAAEQSEQL